MVKILIKVALIVVGFNLSGALACDFECTYKKHINAIDDRDYQSFESTLTKSDQLVLILPDGRYIDNGQEYRKVLKGWFDDDG